MKSLRKKLVMPLVFMSIIAMMLTIMPSTRVNAKAKDCSNSVVKVVVYVKGGYYAAILAGTPYNLSGSASFGDANGDGWYSSGTGFFVGKNGKDPSYIITNEHVIDDYLNYDEDDYIFIDTGYTLADLSGYSQVSGASNYPIYLVFDSIEVRVYYSEDDYDVAHIIDHGEQNKVDLALLQISEPTDKREPLQLQIPDDDKLRGETVYAYGFPGISDNDFSSGSDTYEQPTLTSGVYNQIVMDDKGVERISSDAKINHGNSGGPLCTEDGKVIGVNTNSASDSTDTRYYAISSSHVKDLLDKNDVDYVMAGSSHVGVIVTIILVVVVMFVVVVAVVVLIIVLNKKKKSKNQEKTVAASAAGPQVNARPTPVAGSQVNARPTPAAGQQVNARPTPVVQPQANTQQVATQATKPQTNSQPETSTVADTGAVYCPHCGRRLTPDTQFCPGCGAKLK